MVYYEICNLYEEHYNKYELIGRLKTSNFTYFGILHNRDYFPTGEAKKPHFHLVIGVNGDSRHTKEEIVNFFNDSTLLIRSVRNPKGYLRYLTHKDNLEKAQYEDKEVFMRDTDKSLYEDLVERQLKMSNTDTILNQYEDFVLSPNFDFNNAKLVTYAWFKKKGKIDYFLKNEHTLYKFVQMIIELYIKGYYEKDIFLYWN